MPGSVRGNTLATRYGLCNTSSYRDPTAGNSRASKKHSKVGEPPNLHQTSELAKPSGLDLIVKYAVLLSWFVYAAGLTRISGFLRSLGVPTEPNTYALPIVLSYGAYFLMEILEAAALAVIVLKLSEKQPPRQLWKYIGWLMPAVVFVVQNYWLWWSIAPGPTRVRYAVYFMGAAYIVVYLFDGRAVRALSVSSQVLAAALLFFLVAESAGYRGDFEAYEAINNPPSVQFLLAPDAVTGVAKLGVRFSSLETGLTEPLNVVVVSEKMYYVRIPLKLGTTPTQGGIRLDWEPLTVAISREKVLAASNKNSTAPQ